MNKNKPDIRFKGFSGVWEYNQLGNLMNVTSVRRIHQSDWTNSGVRFLRARDIISLAKKEKQDDYLYISKEKYDECSSISGKVNIGDILVTGVGTIGVPLLITDLEPLYFKDGNIIWFQNNNKINGDFLYFSFFGTQIQEFINESAGIGTVGTYTIESGKKTPILLPNKIEQKKIGTFFKHLDSLISLYRQKCEKLKNIKKAMLEKMFLKEGSNVPEIRFKGFTDIWQKCKYADLATTRRGLTYNPSDISDDGIRVLRSSNINENIFIISKDDIFVYRKAINIEFAKENDILITAANGSLRLVGKHAIIKGIDKNTTVHGGFMLLATASEPYFVNALMGSIWYSKFINLYVLGGNGAIGNLNKKDLDEQQISVPIKIEQNKIGTFFKHLDSLINLYQHKYKKLKNIKKALLEKMFV